MPRTARAIVGGLAYHGITRGNGGRRLFRCAGDYDEFLGLLATACGRVRMRLLAYCLMPNHVHLTLWPRGDSDTSRMMQWLLTSGVRRLHRRHGTQGRLLQGRFKAFAIQRDEHLLTVLRYVERNPLRAGLVDRAEDWRWSSLRWWSAPTRPAFLHPGPIRRPDDWIELVNRPQTEQELADLRRCVARQAPFGKREWVERTVRRLGLESSVRPRGRPRKWR